jgi:phosphoribosylformimino-5-aminoimidazole carboxamide ribotide isomerase
MNPPTRASARAISVLCFACLLLWALRAAHAEAHYITQVAAVGPSRLVLDLSCRRGQDGKYYVCTDRWQKFTTLAVDSASLASLASSCDEFLVHGVDVEGKKLGIDAQLVALLGQHSPVPVTYAGGAASLADLDQVAAAGKGRVDITVGSALDIFGGKLAYADVLAWHHSQQRLH